MPAETVASMTNQVAFGARDLAAVMPFGFVADALGRIVNFGNALHRLLEPTVGATVDAQFEIVRPASIVHFLDLPADPCSTVVLRARRFDLELKGCKIAVAGGANTAFWASASLRDIDDFHRRGLQLTDFAPGDATPDLLLSMQATRAALDAAERLGRELQAALASARAADDAKARFLAVMSHEIRTPLNGFGAMIDLLRDSTLGQDQRENLETMDLCARSLQALVGDILEYSQLEARRVDVHRAPHHGVTTLQRLAEPFRATAIERGLAFDLRIELPGHEWLYVDAQRVRQILAILVGNALKFTTAGHVAVQVARCPDKLLAIDVVDTGIGIPEDHRSTLFEPFVQADSSTTRRFGGTGLGLSIARRLARAMGGDVVLVRSDRDGSWFRGTILAPTCDARGERGDAIATGPASDATTAAGFAHKRVLVADDDRTNRLVAAKLLRRLGIDATLVENGLQAVEAAARERFDVILMDMMMPQLGGIEATAQIRAGQGPCRDVPILAFTAAAFAADRDAALQAGMDGFLEKPARLAALRDALQPHLG